MRRTKPPFYKYEPVWGYLNQSIREQQQVRFLRALASSFA